MLNEIYKKAIEYKEENDLQFNERNELKCHYSKCRCNVSKKKNVNRRACRENRHNSSNLSILKNNKAKAIRFSTLEKFAKF